MAYRELPPRKQPTGPRKIRDGYGTVWHLREIEPTPGSMGAVFCVLLFEAPPDRRWRIARRGDLYLLSHQQLLVELREAKPVPAGKVIPDYQAPEKPTALTDGDFEVGT